VSDVFFDFVEHHHEEFSGDEGVTLKRAFDLWNQFRRETGLNHSLAMHKFREELSAYFERFEERATINGVVYRSCFTGFKTLTVQ
jgi:hypothetical protein